MDKLKLNQIERDPESAKARAATLDALLAIYPGTKKDTVKKWLKEMREHKEFKDGVLNTGHNTVIIYLDTFDEYLRWKRDNYHKRKVRK